MFFVEGQILPDIFMTHTLSLLACLRFQMTKDGKIFKKQQIQASSHGEVTLKPPHIL